jgi:hypothetical protein
MAEMKAALAREQAALVASAAKLTAAEEAVSRSRLEVG